MEKWTSKELFEYKKFVEARIEYVTGRIHWYLSKTSKTAYKSVLESLHSESENIRNEELRRIYSVE